MVHHDTPEAVPVVRKSVLLVYLVTVAVRASREVVTPGQTVDKLPLDRVVALEKALYETPGIAYRIRTVAGKEHELGTGTL